jgi:plasmid stability protein
VTQIIINDLDDKVLEQLRTRAAINGRSLAEEVRIILSAAVATPLRERRSLSSFIGAVASRRSQSEVDAYVRKLRDEWEK